MNTFSKNLILWLIIIAVMFAAFNLFKPMENAAKKNYSDIWQAVEKGEVDAVVIDNQKLVAKLKSGEKWATYRTFDEGLLPILRTNNVSIEISPPASNFLYSFIGGIIQIVIIVAIWLFLMRQMQGGGKAMTFAKNKAKLLNEDQKKVTFKDVAGIDEAKHELEEIIDFLIDPSKFIRLGGRIPKGVLLMGPPGTGKTLLAKAIAGEARVPFFSISGSDFVEMFVGVGASRVRDMFAQGKKSAPCIVFIDEVDAVGRHRGAGLGGGHDEREQTLNQLLVEMDGFETNEGLIIVAATNRPDVLDPALLRPGRFDRQVVVPVPDVKGREEILKVHAEKVPLAKGVDLQVIARGTPGFSGADLANLINEAALMAARYNKDFVDNESLEAARDKLTMGVERKSLIMSDESKKITAWHEAGHALAGALLPESDPVHKVSIIPRGFALGVTQFLPTEEKYNYSQSQLKANLIMLLGGRVAEEIALNEMTTGASNDIERASTLARNMVCKWGMSSLGPIAFGKDEGEQVFLGKSIGQNRNYSEDTALKIDREIEIFLSSAHEKATGLLKKHFNILENLTNALIEKETLDGLEVYDICLDAMLAEGIDIEKKRVSFSFTSDNSVVVEKKEDDLKDENSDGENKTLNDEKKLKH